MYSLPGQMLKIGRNDPCPCGSGKKYKKCCLYKAASPVASLGRRKIRRVESELLPALMNHAEKQYGPAALYEGWGEFTLWDETPMDANADPEVDMLFVPWFLFNWIPDNFGLDDEEHYPDRPIARHYLEHGGARVDSSQRQFIGAAVSQPFSFFMVTGVVAGKQLTLRDLLLQREVTVQELKGSTMLSKGSILYARTITIDDCSVMLGCGLDVIPPSCIDDVIAAREEFAAERPGFGKDYLLENDVQLRELYFQLRHLALNPLPPVLYNSDGDPLQLTTLYYDLNCTPLEALTALASLALVKSAAELEQTGKLDRRGKLVSVEFPWLKKGSQRHENRDGAVLGNIVIDGAELSVDVNSQARVYIIRRKIERRLGHRARFRDREIVPAEDVLKEMENKLADEEAKADGQKGNKLAALPETQETLKEVAEKHWESWLDKPSPALRLETPRDAAKTATGRERLDALFWDYEWRMERGDALDPDIPRLKKILGME
ncbi:MAG: SEC-C metal-binding domain-containing protein [Gammaproteobacteria bacterium]|nr:SEC-C metal-binding domain-containing protein [Gammaproteobacteria bacterium]